MRVRYIMADVGNDHICVDRKLGLGAESQQLSYESDGTHVENVKDPVEV